MDRLPVVYHSNASENFIQDIVDDWFHNVLYSAVAVHQHQKMFDISSARAKAGLLMDSAPAYLLSGKLYCKDEKVTSATKHNATDSIYGPGNY